MDNRPATNNQDGPANKKKSFGAGAGPKKKEKDFIASEGLNPAMKS